MKVQTFNFKKGDWDIDQFSKTLHIRKSFAKKLKNSLYPTSRRIIKRKNNRNIK